MTIRNGPKQTISASSGLGLLQMVSEPDIGRCVSENAGPEGEWIVRSYIGWRGDETFFIRVWKPLLS